VAGQNSLSVSRAVAEWEPCRALWVAWPHDREFWGEHLESAKCEIVELCEVVVGEAVAGRSSTRLEVLVHDRSTQEDFELAAPDISGRVTCVPYDDIWMRDIGPVFSEGADGLRAGCLAFNGWGGKWPFDRDRYVARRVAERIGVPVDVIDLVLEGGAVEFDGEGTCLTTRAVTLNANRNPGVSPHQVSETLRRTLGIDKVVWLDRGLQGDHTDGHIDNIARFVAPGRIACSVAAGADDPNAGLYDEIRRRLVAETDAAGRSLEVVAVPSPGRIETAAGEPLPASYLNYCLIDSAVVVPVFGSPYDLAGVEAIRGCFPGREVIGVSAVALLNGGGGFHCMTLNEPRIGPSAQGK
jgi:agmatine deiminase